VVGEGAGTTAAEIACVGGARARVGECGRQPRAGGPFAVTGLGAKGAPRMNLTG
jgi:hypothetical protein